MDPLVNKLKLGCPLRAYLLSGVPGKFLLKRPLVLVF